MVEFKKQRETLVVVAAALLYAAARTATDSFYGTFSVFADEAGVTTTSLLWSAALVSLVLLGCGWRHVDHSLDNACGGHAARAVHRYGFLVGLSGAGSPNWSDGCVGIALGFAVWWFTKDSPFDFGPMGWRTVATLSIVFAVVVVAVAFEVSDRSTQRVQAGLPNLPALGPFVIAPLHAPTVQVWPVAGFELPQGLSNGLCVSRLGSADGVTVLYRTERVWRTNGTRNPGRRRLRDSQWINPNGRSPRAPMTRVNRRAGSGRIGSKSHWTGRDGRGPSADRFCTS